MFGNPHEEYMPVKDKGILDKNVCWKWYGGKKEKPPTMLVGMSTSRATMEKSMEFPQKTKNRTTI